MSMFCRVPLCSVVLSLVVIGQLNAGTLYVDVKDMTHCKGDNPANGELSANVDGITEGYSFFWYRGEEVKELPDFTGSTVLEVSSGGYTVIAIDDNTEEILGPVTVHVSWDPSLYFNPSVTALYDETHCSDYTLCIVSVDGFTSGYTFKWYEGSFIIDPPISELPVVYNLSKEINTYSILAVNNKTECASLIAFYLDKIGYNDFNLITESVTNLTSCGSPNGELSVSVNGIKDSPFSFEWFEGETTAGMPFETGFKVENLLPGVYTVKVYESEAECLGSMVKVIEDTRVYPDATITNSEGKLTVPFVGGNNYRWIKDGDLFDADTHTITPVESGVYQVEVTTPEECSDVSDPVNFIINGEERELSTRMKIYPVPAKNQITIGGEIAVVQYQINDITGKVMLAGTHSTGQAIDISALSTGLYIITVRSDNTIIRKSLLKE